MLLVPVTMHLVTMHHVVALSKLGFTSKLEAFDLAVDGLGVGLGADNGGESENGDEQDREELGKLHLGFQWFFRLGSV